MPSQLLIEQVESLCNQNGAETVFLALAEHEHRAGLAGSALARSNYIVLLEAFALIYREAFDNMNLQVSIDEMTHAGWVKI